MSEMRHPLAIERDYYKARVEEYERSFELYNKASMALMHAYKAAHPDVPENAWPDASKVNAWAVEQIATLADNRDAWTLLATQAQERIATLTQELAECRGNDLAANPSTWSHRAQIAGLTQHLMDADKQVATLTNLVHEIRPKSECYERVCQALGIDHDIIGHVRGIEAQVATLAEQLDMAKADGIGIGRLSGDVLAQELRHELATFTEALERIGQGLLKVTRCSDVACGADPEGPLVAWDDVRTIGDAAIAAARGRKM